MIGRYGGQCDSLSGYRCEAFELGCGRLSDRFGADLKGDSGPILRKPFGLAHCAVVIAAAFLAKSICGRLLPLTAGMPWLAVIDDTTANAGRDLSGDQEYEKNCCESFKHSPREIWNLSRHLSTHRFQQINCFRPVLKWLQRVLKPFQNSGRSTKSAGFAVKMPKIRVDLFQPSFVPHILQ